MHDPSKNKMTGTMLHFTRLAFLNRNPENTEIPENAKKCSPKVFKGKRRLGNSNSSFPFKQEQLVVSSKKLKSFLHYFEKMSENFWPHNSKIVNSELNLIFLVWTRFLN